MSSTSITMPTEEDLLQGDMGQLILDILETVKTNSNKNDMDLEVETAAKAIDILTGTAEFLQDNNNFNRFSAAFASAIWLLGIEEEHNNNSNSNDIGASVISVIKAVIDVAPTLKQVLIESVANVTLLHTIGLVDMDILPKKIRLANTATYFRQHKFNLLSEESEGYSKLLYLLQKQNYNNNNNLIINQLQTIIGTFSLDPNRCMDIAVDVLEFQLHHHNQDNTVAVVADNVGNNNLNILHTIIEYLSSTTKLPALLGFKLHGRSTSNNNNSDNINTLLKTMAWLARRHLLSVSDMIPFLPESTDFESIVSTLYEQVMKNEREHVNTLGKVRLSGTDNKDTDNSKDGKKQIDLSKLKSHIVIRWLEYLLKDFDIVREVFISQWPLLAFLLPNTVGVAILDWVGTKLPNIGSKPPWDSSSSSITTTTTSSSVECNMKDLIATISEPLDFTFESGCIALRPVLYTRLCRVLAKLVAVVEEKHEDVIPLLRDFMVPSLCVFNRNPALSMELWEVIKLLPYRQRYSLYRSWKGSGLERAAIKSNKPLWLIAGEILTGKDARYYLKRLSKDTIRDMSRAVAKCCHSHPLVVFTTILNQIESYDNLIQVMVDSCRFVTPLSLDVLGFCILERLSGSAGGGNRNRYKESGVNVSQWLQSLESFVGAFYKRYPLVEFQGIICYLMQQLKEGNVTELGVLRTLLKSSGGWSFADYAPAASLSMTQLEGRAGSTSLQRETMAFGIVDNINIRASSEVRRVLQTDNMGATLLILLAQVRNQIIFEKTARPKPVKLIGNLVDTCQVVMAILLDFLSNEINSDGTSAIEKYAKSFPPLDVLCSDYKMETAAAWMIFRPVIRANSMMKGKSDVLKPYLPDRAKYDSMLPAPTWSYLTFDVFEVFFSLSLYDIFCPEALYANEIARLEDTERQLQKKTGPSSNIVQPGAPPEKSDEQERERIRKVLGRLEADRSEQQAHVVSVKAQLATMTTKLFVSDKVSKEAAMTFFVRCIYPRCMQGPDDALFCAYFILVLHENATKGLSTMHLFDAMIVILAKSLYCLTEGEAACVSILLTEIWKVVSRWRYEEDAFKSELGDKPGAFIVMDDEDGEPKAVTESDYENLYNKWHAAIGSVCVGCLKSSEYMHKRNCLVVLTRMVDVFPTRPRLANRLEKALEPLQDESNNLADIRASAQAYHMQLIKARDEGVWKEEDEATVQARQAKADAAAAERHKKAEEQMEELKRESEKISEEIGGWDRNDRPRGRDRQYVDQGPQRDRFDDDRRAIPDSSRRRQPVPDDRRNVGARPTLAPRESAQHAPAQGDRWHRDRGGTTGASYSSTSDMPATRRDDHISRIRPHEDSQTASNRGLESRWQRAPEPSSLSGQTGVRKRSRPSSPIELGESREDHTKRMRPSADDDDGGSRSRRAGGNISHRRRPAGRR